MNNTIQHYYFKDMSSYGKNIKLHTSIENLKKQTEESKGSLRIITQDDAATVEISARKTGKILHGMKNQIRSM